MNAVTNTTGEYLLAHAEIETEGSRVEHVSQEFQRAMKLSDREMLELLVGLSLAEVGK